MTFEGWNPRYYGDAMALPGDALAHFRTKGSKNGVRRYQQPDGTWTPLGLRLRKAREGWGERRKEKRKERKEKRRQKDKVQLEKAKKVLAEHKDENERYKAKLAAKTKAFKAKEKAKADRIIKRIDRREELKKRFAERNLKNLSDEELRKRIERVKMEKEYKELTKSPALAVGEKMLKSYLESRKAKRERAEKKAKMEKDMIEAKAKLATAEADKAFAKKRGNIAARKISAKADLKAQKNKERDKTIRGAISKAINRSIDKRSANHVKKMGDKTYWDNILKRSGKAVVRVGNAVKTGAQEGYVQGRAQATARRKKKQRQQAAQRAQSTRLTNYYNNGGW